MRRPGLAVVVVLAAVAGLAQPARPAQQPAQTTRPDLQRILDGLVTGSGRVAPGATALRQLNADVLSAAAERSSLPRYASTGRMRRMGNRAR